MLTLIICTDKNNRYSFAGKRTTKDKSVTDHIYKQSSDATLYIEDKSVSLFSNTNRFSKKEIRVITTTDVPQNGYRLVENDDVMPMLKYADRIIHYKWNEVYPGDYVLDVASLIEWEIAKFEKIKCSCHEDVTVKIYVRKAPTERNKRK